MELLLVISQGQLVDVHETFPADGRELKIQCTLNEPFGVRGAAFGGAEQVPQPDLDRQVSRDRVVLLVDVAVDVDVAVRRPGGGGLAVGGVDVPPVGAGGEVLGFDGDDDRVVAGVHATPQVVRRDVLGDVVEQVDRGGVGEDRGPPHHREALVDGDSAVDATLVASGGSRGAAGSGCGEEGLDRPAPLQAVLDNGDQRRPPGAGLHRRGAAGAQDRREVRGPRGGQRPAGATSAGHGGGCGGGHCGGDVTADPPPQGGGGVIVRQGAGAGGVDEQRPRVDTGPGQPGQPVGQDRGERVAGDGGGEVLQQAAPLLEGRGPVALDAAVQGALPGVGGLLQLGGAGGATVARVDLHGRTPHLHVGDDVDRRCPHALAKPRRHVVRVGGCPARCPDRCPAHRPARRPIRCAVGAVPDLFGEVDDALGAGCQVGPPRAVVDEAGGDCGQPGQRSAAGAAEPGAVESPVQDGGGVAGVVQPAPGGRDAQGLAGVVAGGGEQQQVRPQRGPRRGLRDSPDDVARRGFDRPHRGGADDVLGCDVQGVEVAGGGLAQLHCGVGLLALQGGGGGGGVVAGEDGLQLVDGGERADDLGSDDAVRVAVADDLEVDVIGQPAAAEHRVQLLAGLLAGGEAVHGVHRHALRAVHGGGVAELGRGRHIVGGQPDAAPGAGVLGGHVPAVVDLGEGPPVAVLHPVRGACAQLPVVGAGDEQIAVAGQVAVREPHHGRRRGRRRVVGGGGEAGEAVGSGPLVEVADQVVGGGEHDGVQAGGAVDLPGREHRLRHGGEVADVDPALVEVEAERFGSSVAQCEGGGTLGGVAEAQQLAQVHRAVAGLDVAEHAAGADRGQLLVVPDQAHAAAAAGDEAHRDVQGQGVGHARFVDDHQRGGVDAPRPLRQQPGTTTRIVTRAVTCGRAGQGPDELGQGLGVGACLLSQGRGSGGGGGQADDVPAVLGPRGGQHRHGGRLPRPGGRDGQLEPGTGGRHVPHEGDLPGVEGGPVGRGFEEGDVDRVRGRGATVASPGEVDQPPFGGQDDRGGVQVGAGDPVHAAAVDAAQLLRLHQGLPVHGALCRGQRHRTAVQDLRDQGVDGLLAGSGGRPAAADLALRLGADVPHLPRRAAFLHRGEGPSRGRLQPRRAARVHRP